MEASNHAEINFQGLYTRMNQKMLMKLEFLHSDFFWVSLEHSLCINPSPLRQEYVSINVHLEMKYLRWCNIPNFHQIASDNFSWWYKLKSIYYGGRKWTKKQYRAGRSHIFYEIAVQSGDLRALSGQKAPQAWKKAHLWRGLAFFQLGWTRKKGTS